MIKMSKVYVIMAIVQIICAMVIVYISPRLDIITLFLFAVLQFVVAITLIMIEGFSVKQRKKQIDAICHLLHSPDLDYEIIDDDFGLLRDEIKKILLENKRIAQCAEKNQLILQEYTENIAHQVKTPLTGLKLMLNLMQSDKMRADEYLSHMSGRLNRLEQLTDILLKMAALDTDTLIMNRDTVCILDLLEDIKAELQDYFQDENIVISFYGAPFLLICDKRWTYEAIFNIVKNGIEATAGHKVNIYMNENHLFQSIVVEDFSHGMDKEMLNQAYKRFHKTNQNTKGYGIGLPMAKSIIEKQHGELLYRKGPFSNSFELRFYR